VGAWNCYRLGVPGRQRTAERRLAYMAGQTALHMANHKQEARWRATVLFIGGRGAPPLTGTAETAEAQA